ncbi:hypothetical protein [Saccharothrix sp. NRRL B-16348]|uniref:hypothetical protein n=1 Tax=Saccharothrix sp. NRRL B-16348 TaxID=1415542 RepID=UPI0007C83DDB|nr:hypothetical protein [Saccharothrix sp. NRRL B-16348]
MTVVDQYDVDEFNVLDPPSRPPVPEADRFWPEPVAVVPEPPEAVRDGPRPVADDVAHRPVVEVEGNSNDTALRDVVKPVVTIRNVIFGDQFAELVEARPRKRSGRGLQDHAALEHLASRFVPPPGLLSAPEGAESAFGILRREQVLLLTANERRGGQFVAGLRLGYELQKSRPELVVREELIDRLSDDDLLVEDEPAVVVVDLRSTPHDELQAVRLGLVELGKQFVSHRSYLILIFAIDRAREFGEFLHGRMHRLERPEPVEVFTRHLGDDAAELISGVPELADYLRDLWPPAVKDVTDAVSDRVREGEEPRHALREVLRDRQEQGGPPLREIIRAKQTDSAEEWLALLLAAALLEGAAPWHIVYAADLLLDCNGTKPKKTPPLLTPSPYARLSALEYKSFDFETRRFQPPGSGAEVFRHFWQEHRGLQDTLLKWISALPRRNFDLTRDELERFADRCAELAGCGGVDAVLKLAESWAKATPGAEPDGDEVSDHWKARYRRSIAVRLLTTTAMDPAAGTRVRQRLLDWSKAAKPDLQLLTAQVCAGIGESFPRIALTRLKYLADSENPRVWEATRKATLLIGAGLGTASFLRHVAEWSDHAGPARLRLLVESTAVVLAQDEEDGDLDVLVDFWRQALDVMPVESLYPAIGDWLRTAAEAPFEQWGRMVEPLILATDGELKSIGRVHHAGWRALRHGRETGNDVWVAIADRLFGRLDEIDILVPE